MNTKKFSEALGEVDDKYVDKAMSYKPKRRNYNIAVIAAAAACLGAAVYAATALTPPSRKTPDAPLVSDTTAQSAYTEEVTASAEPTTEKKPLRYTELVKHDTKFDLEYDDENGSMSIDIAAFDDMNVKNCTAVIEGEIIDVCVKNYEFDTPFDKFEPNGVMHNRTQTIAYKIRADKVLFGDVQVGDIVDVEDEIYMLDSLVSMHKGGRYVVPIGDAGEYFYADGEIISGSNKRGTRNCTFYQFIPQIEAVESGYIVPYSWEHIVTPECEKIIMDIEFENGDFFNDKMYFVPSDVFNTQMNKLLAE